MNNLTRLDFTAAELRELHDVACTLLREPLGVFPGPPAAAAARVTAAMKLLRADAAASHPKFVDLPALAPFAARIVVETLAPAVVSTPARSAAAAPRAAKPTTAPRARPTSSQQENH